MASTNLQMGLIETLLQLHEQRRTGVLRCERLRTKRQIVVKDGLMHSSESNLPDEHLARILVQERILGTRDLNQVSQLMKAGRSAEEAILATNKVDSDALQAASVRQAHMILAAMLGWEEFEMRFFPGEGHLRRQSRMQIPLAQFLMMTARWMVDQRKLPPGIGKLHGMLVQSEWGKAICTKLPLEQLEAYAYSQTRFPVDPAELIPAMPVPEGMRPEEPLQRLMVLGLVEVHVPQAKDAGVPVASEVEQEIEAMLQKFEVSSHYEILSLPSNATDAQIRDIYHELAKAYHPDRFQSREFSERLRELADKAFTYITGAYAILSDPAARVVYDESRAKSSGTPITTASAEKEKDQMAETLFRAGRAALAKGEFEKAAGHFKESVWLRPNTARYQHFLGVAQSEVPKQMKEAEAHLQKAIELDKTSVDSYLALGKLYMKVKLTRRAEIQFQEVLKWDANNKEALRLLERITS